MNSRFTKAVWSSKTVSPLVVVVLGLCIAVATGLWSKRQVDDNRKAAFGRAAQRVADNITQRFFLANYGLAGARGLYSGSEGVSRKEFQSYVASRDLPKEFPGVRGFGFIERVSRDGLNAFVDAERADDAPQFSIRQLEDRSQAELYVIKFIEPAAANVGAQGLDVGSEPLRRAALQRAIDTGKVTMTQAVALVQNNRKSPGVLLFMPVYKVGANLSTAAERRAALKGLVYAPIVLSELLDAIPDFVQRQIDFELFEGGVAAAKETLYYDADNHLAKLSAGQSVDSQHLRSASQALPLFGQALTLRVNSLPAFDARFDNTAPWFIFATLALLSAAIAMLLRLQANGLQNSELRAQEMTEKLRQEEKRWRELSANASDWFWETDAEHIVRFITENIESFYGLPATQLLGSDFKASLQADTLNSPDLIKEQLRRLEERLPLKHFEQQIRVADGSVCWSVISAMPQFDADGRFCGYRGNGSDITERKNAEAATALLVSEVRSLNQRLSLATDSAQIGVWDYAIAEDKISWNRWMYVLYGVREEDFGGAYAAWRAGLHPDDAERGDAEIAQALHGEKPFDTEFRVVWPSGEVRHLKAAALVLRDDRGAPLRMIGINYDITERKQTEAALRESAQRVQSIVETLVDGLITIDDKGLVLSFNGAAQRMFSRTEAEVIGQPMTLLMPPRYREAHAAGMDRVRAGAAMRIKGKTVEWHGLRGDGSEFPVELVVTEMKLPDQTLFVGVVRDITERKRIEADLAASHLQAEAANLAKTAFLANMSHEIRSPLNAILGLAYLLEQASLEQEPREMVRKIRNSGRLLLGIISDILDMSKIEAGQMLIEHVPFDLEVVLDNVGTALGLSIGAKDIELILSPLPAGVRSIVGDATRLQQVLINLASNAAKFTQAGRIEVRIELLNSTGGTDWLRFAVHDTGIGIAPELQGGVFSAFVQADTSTTRRFGGTGLGLAICRQLVSLMGGEIGLNSVPGEGSEFWFTLPIERIDTVQYSSPSLVQLEVLIADDSDIALQAIGAVAQSLGWQVSKVDSGAAAVANVLEREGAKRPDVVVLDWKMPGMNGLAVARAIRAGVPPNECPIVIMATAQSLTTLTNQPGAELADALLSKPVTASALHNAVLQAQRHRAATQGSSPAVLRAAGDLLAGVRLLVVDDSDINRDVAQRILSGQGATVTLAEDGQQAVDWLLAHPFDVDLVLMDVQMPVLDGMEATRRLRRLAEFDDLPIVALTAGAFKTQQQAAMAAGMTEFVSKPFDVPLTVALIRRLHRPSRLAAAAPVTASSTAVATPAPQSAVATGVMDLVQGRALWSDLPTYQTYLRRFAASYSDAVETMRSSLARSDRPSAAALAHKLSGVAANLALPDARRAAQEAEHVLGTQDDPEPALAQLSRALVAVLAEIDVYARSTEAAKEAPSAAWLAAPALSAPEQAALKQQLIKLLLALDSDNPVRIKREMTALEQQLPAPALAAILVSVLGYDFRAAEARTRQLAIDYAIELGD